MTDTVPNKITVRGLDVRVRASGHLLLRDVALDVRQNQITGIIGESGAGKSTLLKCLNRLIDFDPTLEVSGTIRLGDQDIRAAAVDADEIRRRVGIVFQQPVTFHGTIERNVMFAARRLGIVARRDEGSVLERSLGAAHLWDEVKDRLGHSALTLSVGQQQRLAIARCLAGDPEVLLMDEPTSALDARSTAAIEETILELRATKTIVLVTHQLEQARRLADWLACICPHDGVGMLVEAGLCKVVLEQPQSESIRRLIGLPAARG